MPFIHGKLRGRTNFRQQLVITFCIGIVVAALISSIAIAYLSEHNIRDRFLFEGHQAAETLASQSTLALLYYSRENIEEYAEALLSSPDITGIAVIDADHEPLLRLGRLDDATIAIDQVPDEARLLQETDGHWYFVAPVFAAPGQSGESPFSSSPSEPELLGHIQLSMSKTSMHGLTGDLLMTNLGVSGTLAIAVLAILLLITGRVTRPIKQLAGSMQRAASGESRVRANVDGPRDIAEMQAIFNQMMDALEARQAELRRARDDALESARIKGEFAATVTHELRTPLNGVLGMLELLKETSLDDRQVEYVNVAASSGESLLSLINDILDFSRNESGQIELHEEDVDLTTLLDSAIGLVANQVNSKHLDIGYWLDPEVPERISTDHRKLFQIIVNLIGNAVKFTDRGEIAVTIAVESRHESGLSGDLRFEVRDTGIGIPEASHQQIFEPFRQADGSTTRKHGGTGLGLAICRQLVEVMGGEILVRSRDEGTSFIFTLPFNRPADQTPPPNLPLRPATELLAVVVDDSAIVRQQVRTLGMKSGVRVLEAETLTELHSILENPGKAAVEPRLVLIDERLKGESDQSLTDAITSIVFPEDCRIVLMGHDGGREDLLTDTLAASHLRKPLRAAELQALFSDCRASLHASSGTTANRAETLEVLVVEDNRSNQYVVSGMLEHLGLSVTLAQDGRHAIEAINSRRFDLILMDCNMPEMDGYECTRKIREAEPADHRTPVIAMTANRGTNDLLRCLEYGMDDYIAKPLKLAALKNKICEWTGLADPCPAIARHDQDGERPGGISDPAIGKTLDRPLFNELRSTLGSAFPEMLRAFVEDLPRYLQELDSALKESNLAAIPTIAHTIKGSASNIGARRLSEICRHLEEAVGTTDATTVRMLYNSVAAESEMLAALLESELTGDQISQMDATPDEPAVILIADDDRSTRITFRNVLEKEGYRVIEAENGITAIESCNSSSPDLVLMDGRMPVLDGFSACHNIKQEEDSAHIPVLIITGLDDEDSIEKAFSVGATDYISKPVNFSVLRKRISHLLHASRAERHMHRLAYSDPLTGLPNRIRFTSHLDRLLRNRHERNNSSLAVMFIDVDRFKLINDTLGHDTGDMLLKIISERLSHCVRDGDMVARLGGDEFTIVLDDIISRDILTSIARKICDAFSRPVSFLDQEIFITLSIGISMCPGDAGDMTTLMKHADTAMFNAKHYRNDFRFFEYGMEADVARRLKLENDLRRAIERDQLDVHYQPQIETATGRLIGVEALVRWQHPERGSVPPADFISLAEETGLISQIGEVVLEKACRQLRDWIDSGYPTLRMAVNLSARQLEKYEVLNAVRDTLEATGIPPECLELEITESVIMEHAEEMISVFRKLKDMGLHLAIDDFGTGYSSLAYLKRFPIDLLKIDRSFIQDIPDNQEDVSIITGVIAMAKGLGLRVIAEGVETEAQAGFLREIGCDYMQGYHFSAPVPGDEFERRFLSGLPRRDIGGDKITPFRRGKPGV